MNRKQLFNILKVVVSIGLLIFIFNTIDMQAFVAVIRRANPWWLLAALAIMILGVFIRAFRWQILLNAINVPVPLGQLTAIYFIGFLFNNLLPSGLGGDAIGNAAIRTLPGLSGDDVAARIRRDPRTSRNVLGLRHLDDAERTQIKQQASTYFDKLERT